METAIFWLVIGIFILMNLFDFFTSHLNNKARFLPIPDNVKDVYDQESYEKWRAYSGENERLSTIRATLYFLLVLALLAGGHFASLAEAVQDWSGSVYLQNLLFLGILFLASFIVSIFFRAYSTFSIEERYGFNRSTVKLFIRDTIIRLFLTVIFGGGIILLLVWLHEVAGSLFFLYAFIAVMAIFLFVNLSYVKIFVPLFNKLTPLEEGELKEKIENLAKKENYEVKKISVMDASRRSTKLNAFFSGFGRFKNVVLFDTLLDKMSDDEVVAVLAHEIGHAKHKDVLKNLLLSSTTLAIVLALLYLFISIDAIYAAFGLDEPLFAFGLLLFAIVVNPVTLLINMAGNVFSRKAEYKADRFAAESTSQKTMQSALKVLARENFSHLTPHPLFVFLHYSHPPIKDRVGALERL